MAVAAMQGSTPEPQLPVLASFTAFILVLMARNSHFQPYNFLKNAKIVLFTSPAPNGRQKRHI